MTRQFASRQASLPALRTELAGDEVLRPAAGASRAAGIREVAETRFDHDFSRVRVSGGGAAGVVQRQAIPGADDPPRLRPRFSLDRGVRTVRVDDFDSNQAAIKPQHQAVLEGAAETIKTMLMTDPGAIIFVTGYTDAVDKPEHNMALGQQRAEAVVAYLVSQGVPQSNLHATSLGEAALLVNTDKAEPRNRRVDLDIPQRSFLDRKINLLPGKLTLGLPPPKSNIDIRWKPPQADAAPNLDWMLSKQYDDLVKSMRAQKKAGKSISSVAGDAAYELAGKLGLSPKMRERARKLGESLPAKVLSKVLEQTDLDPQLREIAEKVGEGLMKVDLEEH